MQENVLSSKQAKVDPLVSIVIATKNEEKNIGNCLRSIRAQSLKNIELIVVDNFSEDMTVEITKKYGAKVHTKGPEGLRRGIMEPMCLAVNFSFIWMRT